MVEDITGNSAAPFNNAIDCLMRISEIVGKIGRMSTEYVLYSDIPGVRLNAGQAQHIKLRLIKQLFLRAAPLLSVNARAEARNKIDAIILKYNVHYDKLGKNQTKTEAFDPLIDSLMDNIVFFIVTDLQDKGKYYMPPRDDPRRAVLKH